MSRYPVNRTVKPCRHNAGFKSLRPLRIARVLPGMLLSGEPQEREAIRYIAGHRGPDGWLRADVWPSPSFLGLIWAAVITRYAAGRRELSDEPVDEALLRQPCLPLLPACRTKKLLWSVLYWYDEEELRELRWELSDDCDNCAAQGQPSPARRFSLNRQPCSIYDQADRAIAGALPSVYELPASPVLRADGTPGELQRCRARVLVRHEPYRWEPRIIEPPAYNSEAIKPLRWRIPSGL